MFYQDQFDELNKFASFHGFDDKQYIQQWYNSALKNRYAVDEQLWQYFVSENPIMFPLTGENPVTSYKESRHPFKRFKVSSSTVPVMAVSSMNEVFSDEFMALLGLDTHDALDALVATELAAPAVEASAVEPPPPAVETPVLETPPPAVETPAAETPPPAVETPAAETPAVDRQASLPIQDEDEHEEIDGEFEWGGNLSDVEYNADGEDVDGNKYATTEAPESDTESEPTLRGDDDEDYNDSSSTQQVRGKKTRQLLVPYSGSIDEGCCHALIRGFEMYIQCRGKLKKKGSAHCDKLCNSCFKAFQKNKKGWLGLVENRAETLRSKRLPEKTLSEYLFTRHEGKKTFLDVHHLANSNGWHYDGVMHENTTIYEEVTDPSFV